ncbi:MAG TPA: hypothetical protein VL495_07350 [Edaphobacter sp.]|jgi:hypothetical protein|nr:hypothetical protein [Edaphobacter sp.]
MFCLASLITTGLSSLARAQNNGQPPTAESTEQKIQKLTTAMAQAQAQMNAYQIQLQQLQQQLSDLQQQLAGEKSAHSAAAAPPTQALGTPQPSASQQTSTSLDEIRERQAIDESQIATHEQTKVETESKYPLKITGLLLFNAFVNTRQVDIPSDPTYALNGGGTTGLSLRQTVLGFDARGPRVFGAASDADLRVDFFASGSQANYDVNGLLRMRTAHAGLNWDHTRAYVALDRSVIAPYTPTSLVAVGQPPLAWSGNLWSWIPQIGVAQTIPMRGSQLKLEAGLVDVPNPPRIGGTATTPPTAWQAERSRWPGTNARISLAKGVHGEGPAIGLGGYFSPHETTDGRRFNAWAGTADLRVPFGSRFEFLANAYRGEALGGLGAGGYVDYVYEYTSPTSRVLHPLDDIGGWAQLKFKPRERLEFNGAYGIDNPFVEEIRRSIDTSPSDYAGLSRNRSVFGNVIYSPSSYLLFSLEYRKLWTNFAAGPTNTSDVIGLGAGYRF